MDTYLFILFGFLCHPPSNSVKSVIVNRIIFEGAYITWNYTVGNPYKIEFLLGFAASGNDGNKLWDNKCKSNGIGQNIPSNKNGDKMQMDLFCEKGCVGKIGNLFQSCPVENPLFLSKWPSGLRRLTYVFSPGTKSFTLALKGCCWRTLADNSTTRPFKLVINGRLDDSNQLANSTTQLMATSLPPMIDPPPVITFVIGCQNSHIIPAIAFDNDIIQCLLVENPLNLPGFMINQDNCHLVYTGIKFINPGYYPLLIEIRDYSSLTMGSKYINSVQINLMVKMVYNSQRIPMMCDECSIYKPMINTPKNLSCFTTQVRSSTTFSINGSFQGFPLTDNKLKFEMNWAPSGLSFGNLVIHKDPKNNITFSQNFIWSPQMALKENIVITLYLYTSHGSKSDPLFLRLSTGANIDDCYEEDREQFVKWDVG